MASVVNKSSVLLTDREKRVPTAGSEGGLERLAALGALATGLIMTIGSAVDLGVLWLLQRQSNPQWEYVALSSTMDSLPRFVIGITALYLFLYLRKTRSLTGYRVLGGGMIALGLAAAGFGVLMVTSYFALTKLASNQPDAVLMLRSVAIKTTSMSFLYFLVLVPLGVLSLRRPRS